MFAGKFFECPAKTMLQSIKKITELPGNTLIFPGMYVKYVLYYGLM